MALMGSLYAGWSGLRASSAQLGVVGDNIANVNTVGFKAGRAVFSEALAQSMMGAGGLGSGVNVQAIQKMLQQGTLLATGNATDMAVNGDGMFVLKGKAGGVDGTYYTRAGQFAVDQDGFLAAPGGLRVQGYGVGANGTINGVLGDLAIGDATSPPNATSSITLRGNLDSAAQLPPAAFDPANPVLGTNYNAKQSVTVYDSLGKPIDVDVYFSKTAAGAWTYSAYTDGANISGGTAGTPAVIADGTLTFNTDGNLTAHTPGTATFTPVDANNPQPLTFNLGTALPGGSGRDGLTQTASNTTPPNSDFRFVSQDGYSAGTLTDIQVDDTGTIRGVFSNGQKDVLGQVAMATFSAPDQMERLGSNLYTSTGTSGEANVGVPGAGGRGGVVAGALEQSNVDLSGEFVTMIGAQRLFQANSKTIGTADQLLQELMQLKR